MVSARKLIVVLFLALSGAALLAQPGPTEWPFTIQRVVVPPRRVALELERVQQGMLRAMPVADFERRLTETQERLRSREQRPRLVQAHYAAELTDRSLTNGRGQWTVHHEGSGEAVLPIDSLSLALLNPRWGGGEAALLGEFDGESLGLLTPPGQHQCTFTWSARGAVTSDGLSFLLRVPSCSLTTFELKLPADLWLTAPSNALLVSGPFDLENTSKRLWKLQLTGPTPVELHLRKVSDAKGTARTLFAQTESAHLLAPDRASHDFDINLDILHGSIKELTLDGDASLEPFDISVKNAEVKSWRWDRKSSTSALLSIVFRQPIQDQVSLKVRAVAPVQAAGVWVAPALRLRDSISRGEKIQVQHHPELGVARWDHGSFQPINVTAADQGLQIITLVDHAPNPSQSRRPSFLRSSGTVEMHTREANEWRLDSGGATWIGEWTYAGHRGSLDQLTVRLPHKALGYRAEAVEMKPTEMLRGWHTAGEYLTVELKQPLTADKKLTLTLTLRAAFAEVAGAGRIVSHPEAYPWDSSRREGALRIVVDPIFRSQLIAPSVPIAHQSSPAEDEASYVLTFRDQQVRAAVRLLPQPVLVHLRGKQSVVLDEQGGTAQFRWEADPLVGSPQVLDFRCFDGDPAGWHLKPDKDSLRIHRLERLYRDEAFPHLLHLGAIPGLGNAALEQALPRGSLWRFHLADPLRKKSSFALEAGVPRGLLLDEWRRRIAWMPSTDAWSVAAAVLAAESMPRGAQQKAWTIPLLVPVQPLHVEHDIAVASAAEPIIKASASGIRPLGKEQVPAHALHYHGLAPGSPGSAHLRVATEARASAGASQEQCDEAHLTVAVGPDGQVFHQVQFRLWHARRRSCTLGFPAGTQIVAARLQQQWLERLDVSDQADGVKLTLPVDQNVPFARYEVLTRTQSVGFLGMTRVVLPRIDWPMPPNDLRMQIVLSDSLAPMHQERMTRIGIPHRLAQQTPALHGLRQAWHWGGSWFPHGESSTRSELPGMQKQTLLNAERHLRSGVKSPFTVGAALERLGLQLKESLPVIVDRPALQQLGLRPASLLDIADLNPQNARPFWEALGLIHVPCPSGALLTTPQRLHAFGTNRPADLDEAVVEALLHGRDSSAAFVPAVVWAGTQPSPDSRQGLDATGFLLYGDFHPATDQAWEFLPGEAREHVYIVDVPRGRLMGWMAAIVAGMVLCRVHRGHPLVAVRTYLLLLGGGGLLVLWLPATLLDVFLLPMLGVIAGGFAWLVFTFTLPERQRQRYGSTITKPATVAAVTAFLLVPAWSGVGQPVAPRTYTVLLVDGTDRAGMTALVPTELMARLDEIDSGPSLPERGAILLSARYSGQIKDPATVVDAVFDVWSPRDHADLIVPLAGVQLQEGPLLDEAPALPTVHKNGYLFKVRSKGMHRLRVRFSVRPLVKEDYTHLSFTAPKLPQAEIVLQVPAAVQAIRSVHGHGEESVGATAGDREWRAQLGYESRVQVRYGAVKISDTTKGTEVTERHYWDLRPGSLSVTSSFNYSIGKGSVSQLTVAIPDHLQVRSVDLQLAGATLPALPAPLKNWQVVGKGAQRRLVADLAQPVSAPLRLTLDMVPQRTATGRLHLTLPTPLQGKSLGGQLGYRTEAGDLPTTQNLSVQGINAEDFAQSWKKQHLQTITASRAYQFERRGTPAGLELQMQPTPRRAVMHQHWTLEPHYADLVAKCTLSSSLANLVMQEFIVPDSLSINNVTGADVFSWNLHEQRLQVWLRQPCQQTEIALVGWHRLKDEPLASGRRLILPRLQPMQASGEGSTLQVSPVGSLRLEATRLQHLQATAPGNWRYAVLDPNYQAEFRLFLKPAVHDVQGLTRLHATEQGVEVWSGLQLKTDRGQLPPLKVHLKHWPTDSVILDAPGAAVAPVPNSLSEERTWTITHPAGLPHHVLVVARGLVTRNAARGLMVPTLEVEGVPASARWIAWKDLDIESLNGEKVVDSPGATRSSFASEGTLGSSSAWKQAKVTKPLRAVVRATSLRSKVQVLQLAQQISHSGTNRWLHTLDCWLQVREPTTVRLRFPKIPADLSLFLDDDRCGTRSLPTREYLLPLSASAKPQRLRVRMRPTSEDFAAPRLEFPSLGEDLGAPDARVAWVPTGLAARDDHTSQPTLPEFFLQQAALHARLSATVAASSSVDRSRLLQLHQQRFFLCVRQLEYSFAALKTIRPELDLSAWRDRLERTRRDNLQWAGQHGYDAQRLNAEKTRDPSVLLAPDSSLLYPGLPVFPAVGAATLPLRFVRDDAHAAARTHSEIALLVALGLLVFTYFRSALPITHAFAPEIMAAAIVVLMWAFGFGVAAVFALACLLVVRVARLVALARSWVQGAAGPPDAAPSG